MNTVIKTGLAAMLLAISCTKESIHNSSAVSSQSLDKALTFTIGQHYGGGIIFYIDSTGQHGLIADTVDLPQLLSWDHLANTVNVATGNKIGSGKANTRRIILAQSESGNYAALKCAKYKGSGYTDWFLPSKDELNELYKQKNVVGGFADDYYWCSSQTIDHMWYAWKQSLYDGNQNFHSKYNPHYVRAVRAF